MKFFGYGIHSEVLLQLGEVSVQADSLTLRKLAAFILKCADNVDQDQRWEHEHFSDFEQLPDEFPEFIVFRSES